jgi:hypothetical protein
VAKLQQRLGVVGGKGGLPRGRGRSILSGIRAPVHITRYGVDSGPVGIEGVEAMKTKVAKLVVMAAFAASAVVLSACSESKAVFPTRDKGSSTPRMGNEPRETVFGTEGLFGEKKKSQGDAAGIGVNSFLWRATLDTIAFMPIASADPFGGTVLTDWYQLPESPNERFKVNAFIVDRALRADGVKVSVFKQARDATGQWVDVRVDPRMATDLENSILTRARQLRIVSTD